MKISTEKQTFIPYNATIAAKIVEKISQQPKKEENLSKASEILSPPP